jgi:hypothetical protein
VGIHRPAIGIAASRKRQRLPFAKMLHEKVAQQLLKKAPEAIATSFNFIISTFLLSISNLHPRDSPQVSIIRIKSSQPSQWRRKSSPTAPTSICPSPAITSSPKTSQATTNTTLRYSNITWHPSLSRRERNQLNGQRGLTIWLTGLSASGKSTVATALEQHLLHLGVASYRLDGDNVRFGLNKDLGFSEKDRNENIRRIGEVGLLTDKIA